MKKLLNILKSIGNTTFFLLTGKGDIANKAIDDCIIDYSGQGRNKYGN